MHVGPGYSSCKLSFSIEARGHPVDAFRYLNYGDILSAAAISWVCLDLRWRCSSQDHQASKNCRYVSKNFFWSTERRLLRILGTVNYGCCRKNFVQQNFHIINFLLQNFQVWWVKPFSVKELKYLINTF